MNEVLWEPAADARGSTRVGHFMTWLDRTGVGSFADYHELWEFSVADPAAFWCAVRDFFELPIVGESTILRPGDRSPKGLPGAVWFPGAHLNAAEILLGAAGRDDAAIAIRARSDTRGDTTVTFGELRAEVTRVRRGLAALGVGPGDRVAAYAPNIPETVVAFLATVSLGAIWTSCAPEFGIRSVLDRLTQTRPKILVAVDGYRYGSRVIARRDEVDRIVAELDSVTAVVHVGYLEPDAPPPGGTIGWRDLDGAQDPGVRQVPFEHPLWVLYSSGTTGLPKSIVHSHGGISLEHHKALALHGDLGADDRFFWFTTTGWMMWNYLVSGLAVGSTIVLFDGDPGAEDMGALWRLADELSVTALGVSAPFVDACRHRGMRPATVRDLSALRWVGSTGAPLGAESYRWIIDHVGRVPISSISGGTDVCTAFVGGSPLLPVHAGMIPCRFLGAAVRAFDARGDAVIGTEGELVVTVPMPSMPVGLWGDEDGSRLRAAYFDRYPDTWWHGDWITITADGEVVISGRSDATLNRGGVRLGTADFYEVVEEIEGVADALVVHLDGGDEDRLVLFVVTDDGVDLDDALTDTIRSELRRQLSPRHVPDVITTVDAVPRTLSGKKTELPVKRILTGVSVAEALASGALANPESVEAYVDWARADRSRSASR